MLQLARGRRVLGQLKALPERSARKGMQNDTTAANGALTSACEIGRDGAVYAPGSIGLSLHDLRVTLELRSLRAGFVEVLALNASNAPTQW